LLVYVFVREFRLKTNPLTIEDNWICFEAGLIFVAGNSNLADAEFTTKQQVAKGLKSACLFAIEFGFEKVPVDFLHEPNFRASSAADSRRRTW
jgi:hypothetical protein